MKKFYLFLATVLFGAVVFSCTPDRETNGLVDERPEAQEQEIKGVIPAGHPVSEIIFDFDSPWEVTDDYYQKHVAGTDYHYTETMKSQLFFTLMQKGFDKSGSPERRLYHIEEQLSLKTNFPNLQNFYFLLVSCSDFMSREEADEKAMRFYTKNQKAIEIAQWENQKKRAEKMVILSSAYSHFYVNFKK